MNRYRELLSRPIPFLPKGKAFLLRLLMLPNLVFTCIEGENYLIESATEPRIYALNHNNAFESLFVPVYLMYLLGGKRVSFVIDWMYGHLPLIGWLMKQIDPVFVYHKRSTLSFIERLRPRQRMPCGLEQCRERLAAGKSIGIFPEGTRNHDPYRLLRAKSGVGHLALASGVPVVPLGIDFSASGRRSSVPLIGRMVLRVGEPLCFAAMSATYNACSIAGNNEDANRLARRATTEVMLAISGLCGKSYGHAQHNQGQSYINKPSEESICPA